MVLSRPSPRQAQSERASGRPFVVSPSTSLRTDLSTHALQRMHYVPVLHTPGRNGAPAPTLHTAFRYGFLLYCTDPILEAGVYSVEWKDYRQ